MAVEESIPIIIPAVDWSKCVNDDLLPITIKLSVLPPCMVTALAEPIVIFLFTPSRLISLELPKLIDAWVEEISILFASNSNPCDNLTSKFVPSKER